MKKEFEIEKFSNDRRKTNIKVITQTNHNRSKQRDEPIRIPSNNFLVTCPKGGKNRVYEMRLVVVSLSHWLENVASNWLKSVAIAIA